MTIQFDESIMTEDDTFKTLRRMPYHELRILLDERIFRDQQHREYIDFIQSNGWTLTDFKNTEVSIHSHDLPHLAANWESFLQHCIDNGIYYE